MLGFSIDKQTLKRLDNQQVVTGSYNYLYAYFNFSSDWNNVNKNAIFEINGKTYTMPILNNISLVPWEVIVVPDFTVSAYGFTTTKRITTNSISVETNSFITEPENIPQNQPTPTDYEAYVELVKEALKQINDLSIEAEQLLDQAKQYNEQSQQAATNAEASAQQAEASSQSSQASAQNAESSAQNASNSASSAQNSASEASTYAQNAKESETKAEQYSVSAQNSASEAKQYSSSAQESAEQANQSSESAQQYATNAEAYANNAAQSAETAKEYSDNVVSLGTQAVENINSAKDAAIQEITQSKDGALTDINSAQTGAISAISQAQQTAVSDITDKGTEQVNNINSAGSTAISNIQSAETESLQKIQNAQTTAIEDINNTADEKIQEIENINSLLPKPTEADAGKVPVAQPDGSYQLGDAGNKIDDTVVAPDTTWSSLNIVNKLCPPFSVTGAAVQFSPVEGYPLSVQYTIVAMQEGTGDPSPTNVRPIVPVDEVGVWVGGKNLLNLEGREIITDAKFENNTPRVLNGNKLYVGLTNNNYFSKNNITSFYVTKDTVSLETIASGYGLGFDFPVSPGSQLFASPSSSGKSIQLSFYDKSGNFISRFVGNYGVVPDNAAWGMVVFRPDPGGSVTYQNPQVEIGTSATAYEPYRGQLYTAQLPEPCYGGTVDLTGGTGDVTFGVTVVDGTTVKFTASGTLWNLPNFSSPGVVAFAIASGKAFCDSLPSKVFGANSGGGFVYVTETSISSYFATVDELNAFCQQQYAAGTPVRIAYPLATPTPFTFAPLSIPAPASPATAYSTSGEITVSGRSDPIEYINQQIFELSSAILGG